ncbi:MAG TPA: MTH938/NDUFAF3 family protein [Terriglobia bacterium]|nr:MTH938/NDUFAF3 family protein [Terriglobia bacterium]
MVFEDLAFGSIRVDGVEYDHDIVVDCGNVRERKKGPSKTFRTQLGHTPLSVHEEIPWRCHSLVIGTGIYGRLPVSPDVHREAERRKVELVAVPTEQAIALLNKQPLHTNAILHLTC